MNDLLIRSGTVIDGSGAPRSIADVLIHRGHIVRVGDASAEPALRTIEAAGQVVAPGFIDIHAHSDEAMFLNDALESALHMGVTLVVNGNCGGSSAPVYGCAASDLDRDLSRSGLVRSWATFAEYADAIERARPAINVASVTTMGCTRMVAINVPFSTPTSVPTTQATSTATITPRASMTEATAPAMAITEPTERSMPPVAITSVMPAAARVTVETWSSTFHRLLAVAKFGVNNAFATMSSTSVQAAAYTGPDINRRR